MRLPQSIRWRIQIWYGALLAAVTTGLLLSFWHFRKSQMLATVDAKLQEALVVTIPHLLPARRPRPDDAPPDRPPPPEDFEEEARRPELFARLEQEGIYFTVWRPHGDQRSSDSAPAGIPAADPPLKPSQSVWRTRDSSRELLHSGPRGSLLIMGTSLNPMLGALHRLAWQLAGAGSAIVATALLFGAWLTRRALRPITDITRTAVSISDGDLARRIDTTETDSELGQLAAVLNTTFDRLKENFDQQVRFTADASHELRTPLSVILTKAQLALSRERSAAEYRETLVSCERAARRMKDLVHSLLELARLDSGEGAVVSRPCDLAAIARDAVEEVRPLADSHPLRLEGDDTPLPVFGDPDRLHQVITNLIANAVQHTPAGTIIAIRMEMSGTEAVARVTDNGPGIPAEALEHLFDRFYRADKARSRADGGAGLGLAIARAIIVRHGGSLTAESTPGSGAAFTIRLGVTAA